MDRFESFTFLLAILVLLIPLFVWRRQVRDEEARKRREEREAKEFSALSRLEKMSKADEAAFLWLQGNLFGLYSKQFEGRFVDDFYYLRDLEEFAEEHTDTPIREACEEALRKIYNLLIENKQYERAEKLAKKWDLF